MILKQLLTCLMVLAIQYVVYAEDYIITSFGAVPDGKTLSTPAIQSAIDRAHQNGGGRVIIPAGRFLSGSIILRSGVQLHLNDSAMLLGSANPEDYITINRWKGLVMADSAHNISITGTGILDGQGSKLAMNIDSLFYVGQIDSSDYILPEKRPKEALRPQIIEFVNCKNVKVSSVTIRNSASWVQSYYMCVNVTIDKIRVESDSYWNNDGVDIIDCQKVIISNCYVNASDDGICIKSYGRPWHGRPFCDDIHIFNCTIRSSASAVKLGTASFGGFKNILIEKIEVFDTFRSAIALESYGNGILENVIVKDVNAVNTGNAIFIRLGRRNTSMVAGILKDVTIKNLKAEIAFERPDYAYQIRGPALPFFHNIFPSSITGIPGYPVENVTLENIEIVYPGRGNKSYAYMPLSRLNDVPEQEDKYPEFSMFGELPAWGFYVRHVDGLKMKNVKVRIKDPDYRPAFVFDDVNKLFLNSVQAKGDEKSNPFILHNTENVEIVE